MEHTQSTKIASAIIVILLVLVAGYVLVGKYSIFSPGLSPTPSTDTSEPMVVVVENTPMINGAIASPAGFPQDIPLEKGEVLESASTQYPEQNAKQLSISYRSSKTIVEKYDEYKYYMLVAGYDVKEEENSTTRALFGTKIDSNFSVVMSNAGGKTLVQLSYLLK